MPARGVELSGRTVEKIEPYWGDAVVLTLEDGRTFDLREDVAERALQAMREFARTKYGLKRD